MSASSRAPRRAPAGRPSAASHSTIVFGYSETASRRASAPAAGGDASYEGRAAPRDDYSSKSELSAGGA